VRGMRSLRAGTAGRRSRRLDRLEARLEAQVRNLAGRLDLFGDAHHTTRVTADQARAAVDSLGGQLAKVEAMVGEQVAGLDDRVARLERLAAIRAVTEWVRHVEVPPTLLVSVVLPTRDRADVLARAVASVQTQDYDRWELVVVDDGSSDVTPDLLATLADGDDRIRVLRTEGDGAGGGSGVAAARNRALDELTGDVVVYLDDDNQLDPLWLKAVVWAFQQRPDVEVLYGARLIDDLDRVSRVGERHLPVVQLEAFDRARLEQGNMADMGVLAHRSNLPGVRFDPQFHMHADWDLLLQLTDGRMPLMLPVVACYYTSDAPDRLSDVDQSDFDLVRAKWSRR
jgi:hypothetical protein